MGKNSGRCKGRATPTSSALQGKLFLCRLLALCRSATWSPRSAWMWMPAAARRGRACRREMSCQLLPRSVSGNCLGRARMTAMLKVLWLRVQSQVWIDAVRVWVLVLFFLFCFRWTRSWQQSVMTSLLWRPTWRSQIPCGSKF